MYKKYSIVKKSKCAFFWHVIIWRFLVHLVVGHVSYCHHLAPVVVVNNFFKHLLLWNYLIDLHETYDCSLEYPAQNNRLDFWSVKKHGRCYKKSNIEVRQQIFACTSKTDLGEKYSAWWDPSVVKFRWKSADPCWTYCPFWMFFAVITLKNLLRNYCTEFNESWYFCFFGYPQQNDCLDFWSVKKLAIPPLH